ncbi:hypothetical protein TrLO_g14500 [Triparma laevis f. longispina]|uniref:Uncharacterized protein n=1 Tax=Triparma laevis f. longispina TaxID=1714387 RepID=A0A9W7E4V0_9STRA|nr:hypothetical protein TrLO_g14500 [Triparma laevis f. longispina]
MSDEASVTSVSSDNTAFKNRPFISTLRSPNILLFGILSASGASLRLCIAACIIKFFPTSLWVMTSDVLLANIVGSSIAGYVKGAALARSVDERLRDDSASVQSRAQASGTVLSDLTLHTASTTSNLSQNRHSIPSSEILDYCYLLALAGSCTSYGSMMTFALTLFVNPSYVNPSVSPLAFEAFSDCVFSIVASIVISAGSFRFFLYFGRVVPVQLRLKYLFLFGSLSPLLLGAILLATSGELTFSLKSDLFSVLFAPIGVFLRAILAEKCNSKKRRVKYIGTLIANILGTFTTSVIQGYYFNNPEILALTALSNGFASSLSTVSTFVGEIEGEEVEGNSIGYTSITIVSTIGTSFLGLFVGGWRV